MRWLLQFLESYLGLKQKEEGKEVALSGFVFVTGEHLIPQKCPSGIIYISLVSTRSHDVIRLDE